MAGHLSIFVELLPHPGRHRAHAFGAGVDEHEAPGEYPGELLGGVAGLGRVGRQDPIALAQDARRLAPGGHLALDPAERLEQRRQRHPRGEECGARRRAAGKDGARHGVAPAPGGERSPGRDGRPRHALLPRLAIECQRLLGLARIRAEQRQRVAADEGRPVVIAHVEQRPRQPVVMEPGGQVGGDGRAAQCPHREQRRRAGRQVPRGGGTARQSLLDLLRLRGDAGRHAARVARAVGRLEGQPAHASPPSPTR